MSAGKVFLHFIVTKTRKLAGLERADQAQPVAAIFLRPGLANGVRVESRHSERSACKTTQQRGEAQR